MNDLGHVLMPIDTTAREFKMLIQKLKFHLRNEISKKNRDMALFDLLEGLHKLKCRSLDSELRMLISSGFFARTAPDISMALFYISEIAVVNNSVRSMIDLKCIDLLTKSLGYMQIEQLRAEPISYLLKAMPVLYPVCNKDEKRAMKEFAPRLFKHNQNEVYRYNIRDLIAMVEGYDGLYENGVLEQGQLSMVHRVCDAYLIDYLVRKFTESHLTGAMYTSLLSQIAKASTTEAHLYDTIVITKMEDLFTSKLLKNVTITNLLDIYKIYKETPYLAQYWKPDRFNYKLVVQCLESAEKFPNDTDLVMILKLLIQDGLFTKNFGSWLYNYVADRYTQLKHTDALQYMSFLWELGLWKDNFRVMELMQEDF